MNNFCHSIHILVLVVVLDMYIRFFFFLTMFLEVIQITIHTHMNSMLQSQLENTNQIVVA